MKHKHQFFADLSNFPNKLCIFRLVVIVISVTCMLCGFAVIASFVGLVAGITDKIDGLYARKHNMCTELGSLLDQISDLIFNFFVIGCAVVMGVWPIWVLYLWGFRDLSVLCMRTSAGQLGFKIPSSPLGRVATFEMFCAEFFMPLAWAMNSGNTPYTLMNTTETYRYAEFVNAHFHPYICIGMWWLAFLGIIVGIVMQYVAAAKYARYYVQKYDEIHKAKLEAAAHDVAKADSTVAKDGSTSADAADGDAASKANDGADAEVKSNTGTVDATGADTASDEASQNQ